MRAVSACGGGRGQHVRAVSTHTCVKGGGRGQHVRAVGTHALRVVGVVSM